MGLEGRGVIWKCRMKLEPQVKIKWCPIKDGEEEFSQEKIGKPGWQWAAWLRNVAEIDKMS